MPASCVPVFARMPVHSSGVILLGQPTFRLYAARIASRLARGAAPLNPGNPKGRESGEARQACSHRRHRRARVPGGARHPPLHTGPQGMSMSEIRRIVVSLSSVYTLPGWIQSVRKNAVG